MANFSDCKNEDERFTYLMDRQDNVCKFTGLEFSDRGQQTPHGDHCHNTTNFRGFVWSAANTFLGNAEYLMTSTGWDVDDLCDRLRSYMADPGMDIGLEPYPTDIGYSTFEEAVAALNCSTTQAE
jgi:hypothetical protein